MSTRVRTGADFYQLRAIRNEKIGCGAEDHKSDSGFCDTFSKFTLLIPMYNTTNTARKAASINALVSADFLIPLFGDLSSVNRVPLKTSTSFSGSRHEKIILNCKDGSVINLVLKIVSPANDMTIWRSGNFPNREASLVGCEKLNPIWQIIQSPYVGYCPDEKESALLMKDLSAFLFPDVREPISKQDEDLILQTLSSLHARFWGKELGHESFLSKQEVFFHFLGPKATEEERLRGREHPILNAVEEGWKLVAQNLPVELSSFILEPPVEKFAMGLPKTLIHGDSKVGNFAIVPERKLSAFDWTNAGYASPAIEMGWYIAVNASRLSTTKEELLNRYRTALENELGTSFDNSTWQQMNLLAVLVGARTLLWNKALNVQKNLPGAKEEWIWWMEGIKQCYQFL